MLLLMGSCPNIITIIVVVNIIIVIAVVIIINVVIITIVIFTSLHACQRKTVPY